MKGIFGSMFDLNHDGNSSPLEDAGLDPEEYDF